MEVLGLLFEVLKIIFVGRDNEGYTYPGHARAKAACGLLTLILLCMAIYAGFRRSEAGEQIEKLLPNQLIEAEFAIRLGVRYFFETLISAFTACMQALLDNAWLSAAFFALILLFLAIRREVE